MNEFDIIGDVHGCWGELSKLFEKLNYQWDKSGFIHKPCDGRQIIFLGDIIDRGPYSLACYNYARLAVKAGYAKWIIGNHDEKLRRHCQGRQVVQNHGLDRTIREIEQAGVDKQQIAKFLEKIPYFLVLDDGKLAVTHAAWKDSFLGQDPLSKKHRGYCLYGPTTGETNEHDLPVRIDWAINRQPKETDPIVVYGHQPYREVRIINKTYGIDTGCVFGGSLTALRYPEMEIVQVAAEREYESLEGRFEPPSR